MSKLMTPDEMAEELGVSTITIMKWARAGIVPSIKVTGKVTRFDGEAVITSLKEKSTFGRPVSSKEEGGAA